jgi:trehalose 6-phosphate synthase
VSAQSARPGERAPGRGFRSGVWPVRPIGLGRGKEERDNTEDDEADARRGEAPGQEVHHQETPPRSPAKKAPAKTARGGRAKGDRLVVVANRMPVRRVKKGKPGDWETSPGGLVAALSPMLEERGGAWVGWDGSTNRRPTPSFTHNDIRIRPIGMSGSEFDGFYAGFSNKTLWPLYHDSIREPHFHRSWWRPVREGERAVRGRDGGGRANRAT